MAYSHSDMLGRTRPLGGSDTPVLLPELKPILTLSGVISLSECFKRTSYFKETGHRIPGAKQL
jgi:hypothetical protein